MTFKRLIVGCSHLQKSSNPHKFSGLRKVFIEFAKYAHGIPNYDQLYQTIVVEIGNFEKQNKQPAVLSWLTTKEDKRNAIAASKTIPSISDFGNPFGLNEINRPKLNYEYFSELYRSQLNQNNESH